jgi:SAM-dependent methyltransferase
VERETAESTTGWDARQAGAISKALDTSTPNVARMYDYYLGGRENFAADRVAAEHVLTLLPSLRRSAIEHREFLSRVIRFLATDAGIDQYLDIGVGLPTQRAVHEVAHEIDRDAHVAYVDYDPVVVSHGNALLAKGDLSVVVRADLRKPAELLAEPVIRGHLDFGRPVAVLLLAIMHFITAADDPARIIATLRDALAPGSYLVLTHVSEDLVADKSAARRAAATYKKASERICPRTRDEILGFFEGFELVEPGLVSVDCWRPTASESETTGISWAGVARKVLTIPNGSW